MTQQPKGILVVRHDGRAEAFATLAAAQARAEEWTATDGHPVEIWSQWTGDLLLVVMPNGEHESEEVKGGNL